MANRSPRDPVGIETWCEDLLRLLDAEDVPRAVIAGHSLGAQVGYLFASRYPERVTGLVLIDPLFRPALRGWLRFMRLGAPLLWIVITVIRFLNRLGLRRRHFPLRDLRALDETTRAALGASGDPQEIVHRYTAPWRTCGISAGALSARAGRSDAPIAATGKRARADAGTVFQRGYVYRCRDDA